MVIDLRLMFRYAKDGPPTEEAALAGLRPPHRERADTEEPGGGPEDERPLVFAY